METAFTRHLRLLVACMLTLALPPVALAQAAPGSPDASTESVAALRNSFDQQLARITAEADAAIRVLQTSYPQNLAAMQSRLQKAGDLEGWTALDGEIKRFKAEQTVPDTAPVGTPSDLLALHERHRRGRADITKGRVTKTMDLVSRYLAHLDNMKRNLTIAGRVNEAMAVHAEIGRAKAHPAVTAAEFDLAATGGPAATTDTPPPVVTSTPPAPTDISGLTLPDGVKMYTSRPPNSPVDGSILKSLPLSPTDKGRTKRKLSVTTGMASVSAVRTDRSAMYYSSYSDKSANEKHYMRATLRIAGTQFPFEGGTMVVQFFAKSVSTQGRISPAEVNVQTTPVPALKTPAPLVVNFNPVSLSSSSTRYSGYFSSESTRSGQNFYGVVVSIFGADGALEYPVLF